MKSTGFRPSNILAGTVIGRCVGQHQHQEFVRFLNPIERAVPAGKIIHAILDNYATHKHPQVQAWLADNPGCSVRPKPPLAAQKAISFSFDTTLEIVNTDKQKLGLVSSGTLLLNRPDKIRVTRHGGFANVEAVFDGKTLSLLGKNANIYGQAEVPGSIDHLDLLASDIYDQLMPEVTDAKYLGSGVIGGVECDHRAFLTKDVDWESWIAQGARRYIITSKLIDDAPQYSVQLTPAQG